MCPSSLRPCSMLPPSKFRFLGQATWTAETSTSTREPPPTAQNAAIFFISASQLRLIWTAVSCSLPSPENVEESMDKATEIWLQRLDRDDQTLSTRRMI